MPEQEKDSENFARKAILVILGGLIGAFITGVANYILQEDNQDATVKLARDKFQSDLIIQSLNSPSFPQALNNLNFIIDAQLIEDPQGKIKGAAIKYQPKIETPSDSNSDQSKSEMAASLERKGFQALLSSNLEEAQKLFESAYNTYPTYHNVDEINKLLRGKKQINNWGEEIYCPILNEQSGYSWGMPKDLKIKMAEKVTANNTIFYEADRPILSNTFDEPSH